MGEEMGWHRVVGVCSFLSFHFLPDCDVVAGIGYVYIYIWHRLRFHS